MRLHRNRPSPITLGVVYNYLQTFIQVSLPTYSVSLYTSIGPLVEKLTQKCSKTNRAGPHQIHPIKTKLSHFVGYSLFNLLSFFLSQVRKEVEEAEELLRIAEKKVIQTLKRESHKIFGLIFYMHTDSFNKSST
jgi:hypothetical protein